MSTRTSPQDLPPGGSPWLRTFPPPFPRAEGDHRVDVAIVGAGLTGLTLAAIMVEKGARVAVLERDAIGSGVTGGSTAKATVLHGARYHEIAGRHGLETAQAYAAAQLAGFGHLRGRFAGDPGAVSWEERAAVTYTQDPERIGDLEEEASVAQRCGIAAELLDGPADQPFSIAGSVRVAGQAQVDPVALLRRTASDVIAGGGSVFERSRVVGLDLMGRSVRTEDAAVHADTVVLATGIPFADRGAFSARLEAQRSYALALEIGGQLPTDMMISLERPTRSLRTMATADGPTLLVGGEGHVTGREPLTWDRYARLADWAKEHFEVQRVRYRWSAQDYESIDLLPYVGPLWPLPTRCLVATGYAKWGITNGAAAAIALAGAIEGDLPPWARPFDPSRRSQVRGARRAAALNGTVVARFVSDRRSPATRGSPRCPHMGGVLAWNPAEGTWDCPLHGSRFTARGGLLQGPAVTDLDGAPAEDEGEGEGEGEGES